MKKLLSLLLALLLLTGCAGGSNQTTQPPTESSETGNLTIHFIDVGQADAILLECDGEYMMVDGGNVADSSLVVSYLQTQGVTKLEAVVGTHAHEDHVGGLAGVLAVYETAAVYAPTRTYASQCFDNFVRYTDQQGLIITIPQPGDVIEFGGATATVLGPVKSYADPNNTSIVLMVRYGDTSFLLTGDMETEAENDMLNFWGEDFDWSADLLKVGHHGSDTSTGYRFLNAVMPQYGIISVGADNTYGHPCGAPLSKLKDAGVSVYRTDKMGNILVISDGKSIGIAWDVASAQPQKPDDGDTVYIGNINSKKLHLPTCSSVPSEKNQVIFETYQQAIQEGYTPCGNCMG